MFVKSAKILLLVHILILSLGNLIDIGSAYAEIIETDTGFIVQWDYVGLLDIPDDDDNWTELVFTPDELPSGYLVYKVELYHNITHTYIGDLDVQVANEDGVLWNVREGDGGSANEIVETVEDTAVFVGVNPDQQWYYRIRDPHYYDTGQLNEMALKLYVQPMSPQLTLNVQTIVIDCQGGQTASLGVVANNINSEASEFDNNSAAKILDSDTIYSMFTNSDTARVVVGLDDSLTTDLRSTMVNGQSTKRYRAGIASARDMVLDEFRTRKGFKVRYEYDNIPAFSAEVTKQDLADLIANDLVVSVEPVIELKLHTAQGIPLMNGSATRTEYSGGGVSIAICDTGVDYTHPQLGYGVFAGNDKVIGGYDYGTSDADPMPVGIAHGTCCSGIAAGYVTSYGDYIGGVAPEAKIYALKISPDNTASMTSDAVYSAWNWCLTHQNDDPDNPILVVSNSFGGGEYSGTCDYINSTISRLVNNMHNAGITVLASAGNDGYCDALAWPACYSGVISVGAVYDYSASSIYSCLDSTASCVYQDTASCSSGYRCLNSSVTPGTVCCYSNSSSNLDILAPSHNVTTTDIAGSSGYSSGNYVSGFGGTSAACPYAAGAVAVIQQEYHDAYGEYRSPQSIRSLLVDTGTPILDSKSNISTPLVNLDDAVLSLGICDGYFLQFENSGLGDLIITEISLPEWLTIDIDLPVTIESGQYLSKCLEYDCDSSCWLYDSSDAVVIYTNDPQNSALIVPVSLSCSECLETLAGDISGDCTVGIADLADLAGSWLVEGQQTQDITGDSVVNIGDLGILAGSWLECTRFPQSDCQ